MYENFYKLNSNPFTLTPNPDFFYPSPVHKKVMAYLQYGVERADGFIVVTGNVGTGKTTIIETLLTELKENNDILVAQLSTTQLDEGDLLRIISTSFGLDSENLSKAALLSSLEKFFREKMKEGKRVLLIVDEAQNLPKKSLEELRMLSNYQDRGRPLFQSFLVGQQQFKEILNDRNMEQLRQRVIAAYHLDTLSMEETRRYIEFRLKHVGWKKEPILDKKIDKPIFEYTGGVPRKINVFCDRLLLHSAMEGIKKITTKEVSAVIEEMSEETPGKVSRQLKSVNLSQKNKQNDSQTEAGENGDIRELEQRIVDMEKKLNLIEERVDQLVNNIDFM